jgi:ubiquinone/menaquinone biosynthesis C-methylase UbiE
MDRYVIRGGRAGAARLHVLARNWAPTTAALFDRVGIEPGARCLDLGCGAGDVTVELARRVGPSGRVVGIDMDAEKLEAAREEAEAAGVAATTEFTVGNAYDFTVADRHDIVYCRFVLQHLSRPAEVLRRMWAAVEPGGVLVVEDCDFTAQFCYPPHPAFTFWTERYPAVLRAGGGDPELGRKLATLFAEADIPIPEITVAQLADLRGEQKTLPILTIEATAAAMMEKDVATEDEINAALAELATLAADETTLFGSPRTFQVWARRS